MLNKGVVSWARSGLLLAAILIASVPAGAVVVEVPVLMHGDDSAKSAAVEQGLERAVFLEAVNLLSRDIPDAREALIKEFLAKRTRDFVLGHQDLGIQETPEGSLLRLDVTIDAQALGQWLNLSGVAYTLDSPVYYDLVMGRSANDIPFDILGRLQAFSGLEPKPSVLPRLVLEKVAATYVGQLDTEAGSFQEQHQDLETLWFVLWAKYFSSLNKQVPLAAEGNEAPPQPQGSAQPAAETQPQTPAGADPPQASEAAEPAPVAAAPASAQAPPPAQAPAPVVAPAPTLVLQGTILEVSGWYSPDGVHAFDAEMNTWKTELSGATLLGINFQGGVLTARWRVDLVNTEVFESRVQQATAAQNLTYTLTTR